MSVEQSAPLLSVCIPTYNRAKLLSRHLEHLRGFRLDLEIVVCDNHSADDTPALAASFAAGFPAAPGNGPQA